MPRPLKSLAVQMECASWAEAVTLVTKVAGSRLRPCVLDLHRLRDVEDGAGGGIVAVLAFAGAREDVELDVERAAGLGCASAQMVRVGRDGCKRDSCLGADGFT